MAVGSVFSSGGSNSSGSPGHDQDKQNGVQLRQTEKKTFFAFLTHGSSRYFTFEVCGLRHQ